MITDIPYIVLGAAFGILIFACWIAWKAHESWNDAEASWCEALKDANSHHEAEVETLKWKNHYQTLSEAYDRKLKELEDKAGHSTKGTASPDSTDVSEADRSAGSPEELTNDYTFGSTTGNYYVVGDSRETEPGAPAA